MKDVMEYTEEVENIAICNREIDDNLTIFGFVCACNVALKSIVCLEPSCILCFPSTTGNNAIILRKIGIPLPMCTTRLQTIEFAFNWRQRQNNPVLRNGAIMDHAAIRRFIPSLLGLFAVLVDGVNDDIAVPIVAVPTGFIPKANHVAGIGIKFGMGGECGSLDLTIKVPPSDRFEGGRVHGKGRAIFFGGEQDTAVEDDVCV
jgi:hypothetical protein